VNLSDFGLIQEKRLNAPEMLGFAKHF